MYSSRYSWGSSSINRGIGCGGWVAIIAIIVMVIVVGGELWRPFDKVSNEREVIVTVTDKAVKNNSSDSKYLIFGEDENGQILTLEITDSLWNGRFNSSDVYAGIKEGQTYKFTVAGSRNEWRSWYPNIYEYELIEQEGIQEESEGSIDDETF